MENKTIPILNGNGFVKLIDVMGTDQTIVDSVMSFWQNDRVPNRTLIDFMFKQNHWAPFEMCELKFHVKLSNYTMIKLLRHRTASINMESLRYGNLTEDFFNDISFYEHLDRKTNSAISKVPTMTDACIAGISYINELVRSELPINEGNKIAELLTIITEALRRGLTSLPNIKYFEKEPMTLAPQWLLNNAEMIQNKVIVFIDGNYPALTYPKDRCRRDINCIVHALAADLTNGGNLYTIDVAKHYYSSDDDAIKDTQVTYFESIWKINLRNFLQTMNLRLSPEINETFLTTTIPQNDIYECSLAMYSLVKEKFPLACSAFEKHQLNALHFNSVEAKVLSQSLFWNNAMGDLARQHGLNEKEIADFKKKIAALANL
jgi:thymidylate synthase ThyX